MASELQQDSMDITSPGVSKASPCGPHENGLTLYSVSANESGEGLPYAPEDFPNPGDKWRWKVGKRISNAGHYVDRYVYVPRRLRQSGHANGFASRLSLKQYVRENFPDTNIDNFFASFYWKIPSKTTSKGNKEMFRFPTEIAEDTGEARCKAGNTSCSSLAAHQEDSFSEVMSCDICCEELGFCRDCCCILCCRVIDKASEGYNFIRCEANVEGSTCGHSCHIDCALRAYMAGTVGGSIGLDAEYYCRRCDSRTDLVLYVTKLLENCESAASRDEFEKILRVSVCVLRGSKKSSANELLHHIEKAMAKLKNGTYLEDIWEKEDVSAVIAGPGPRPKKCLSLLSKNLKTPLAVPAELHHLDFLLTPEKLRRDGIWVEKQLCEVPLPVFIPYPGADSSPLTMDQAKKRAEEQAAFDEAQRVRAEKRKRRLQKKKNGSEASVVVAGTSTVEAPQGVLSPTAGEEVEEEDVALRKRPRRAIIPRSPASTEPSSPPRPGGGDSFGPACSPPVMEVRPPSPAVGPQEEDLTISGDHFSRPSDPPIHSPRPTTAEDEVVIVPSYSPAKRVMPRLSPAPPSSAQTSQPGDAAGEGLSQVAVCAPVGFSGSDWRLLGVAASEPFPLPAEALGALEEACDADLVKWLGTDGDEEVLGYGLMTSARAFLASLQSYQRQRILSARHLKAIAEKEKATQAGLTLGHSLAQLKEYTDQLVPQVKKLSEEKVELEKRVVELEAQYSQLRGEKALLEGVLREKDAALRDQLEANLAVSTARCAEVEERLLAVEQEKVGLAVALALRSKELEGVRRGRDEQGREVSRLRDSLPAALREAVEAFRVKEVDPLIHTEVLYGQTSLLARLEGGENFAVVKEDLKKFAVEHGLNPAFFGLAPPIPEDSDSSDGQNS